MTTLRLHEFVAGHGLIEIDPDYRIPAVHRAMADFVESTMAIAPGEAVRIPVEPRWSVATGTLPSLDYNQVFVDPVTGDILGKRRYGACCFERQHLVPFLYKLHYTLHLPEPWGRWLFGLVALVWVVDCFVGAYLTFPRGRPFLAGWSPAWRIKQRARGYRLNFDLHRAGGLWSWGVLLALAVSSVYLNLNKEVFQPVVAMLSPLTPDPFDTRPPRAVDNTRDPVVTFDDVIARARSQAEQRGWTASPGGVFYSVTYNLYGVNFRPYQHRSGPGLGSPFFYFDGATGDLVGEFVPGNGTAGDVFAHLQFPIHSGEIGGLAARVFIAMVGIGVAVLSVTGVVIWLRKRRRRHVVANHSHLP